jgi:hypothetical protein
VDVTVDDLKALMATGTGTAVVVAFATKLVTGWLRSTALLKAAPAWLVGSAPGQPPVGWRVHGLVLLVAVLIYTGIGAYHGTFAVASPAGWGEALKAAAFAVAGNEFVRLTRGDTKLN